MDQDVIVFIHTGVGQAVVQVNHDLAIKESNNQDITSTFLSSHFLWSQLGLIQSDRSVTFQKEITVMDPRLIDGNNLCQKLRLVGDHCEVFGASVEMNWNFIHSQEVRHSCQAHSLYSQLACQNSTNGFPIDFQFYREDLY